MMSFNCKSFLVFCHLIVDHCQDIIAHCSVILFSQPPELVLLLWSDSYLNAFCFHNNHHSFLCALRFLYCNYIVSPCARIVNSFLQSFLKKCKKINPRNNPWAISSYYDRYFSLLYPVIVLPDTALPLTLYQFPDTHLTTATTVPFLNDPSFLLFKSHLA